MKKQIFLITALAALMTVSCTKSGAQATGSNPDGQIRVRATIANTTSTKGLVGSTTALDKLAFVHAQLATAPAAGTPVDFSGQTPFGGTRAAGAESEVVFSLADNQLYQYDKVDGKISYLMGYSPAQTPVSNSVSWTVTGETDILVSELWNAGTYLVPAATTMTFNHVLARVEVILQSKTAQELPAVRATWGKITGVSFKKAFPRMTFDYATNKVAPGGEEVDKIDLPLLNGNTYTSGVFTPVDIAATGSTTVMASAMVPPTGEASFTLVVSSEKKLDVEIPVTLTAPQATFIAGYGYTVTLNCSAEDRYITVASSVVTPWDETGSGSGNAELEDIPDGGVPVVPSAQPVILEYGVAPYGKQLLDGNNNNAVIDAIKTSRNDWFGSGDTNGGYQDNSGEMSVTWVAEKPYYKFEVARRDLWWWDATGIRYVCTWTEAQGDSQGGLCVKTFGQGWRLPRLSELVVMILNMDALDASGNGFIPLRKDIDNDGYEYWSATESSLTGAWYCDTDVYGESEIAKTNKKVVRCIRELP